MWINGTFYQLDFRKRIWIGLPDFWTSRFYHRIIVFISTKKFLVSFRPTHTGLVKGVPFHVFFYLN